MEADLEVREPRAADLDGITALRIAWMAEPPDPTPDQRRGFRDDLVAWMAAMGDRALCRVAVADGEVVGMAWLVVFDRVPDWVDRARRTGDVQSVFVLPEHRGRGAGRAMLAALLEEADRRGIGRVTVHSSTPGLRLYAAVGFATDDLLLHRRRPDAER